MSPFPCEIVLEPDDVVEFGRRDFGQLDGFVQRFESVFAADRDAAVFSRYQVQDAHLALCVLEVESQSSRCDENRLVFDLVILKGKALAGIDGDDFPYVALCFSPDQLGAPRFIDCSSCFTTQPEISFPRLQPNRSD